MADDTERCPKCYKPLVPIFGNSRTLWCPSCEGHSKQKDTPHKKSNSVLGDDYPNFRIKPNKKDDDDDCGGCGGGCSGCGHI